MTLLLVEGKKVDARNIFLEEIQCRTTTCVLQYHPCYHVPTMAMAMAGCLLLLLLCLSVPSRIKGRDIRSGYRSNRDSREMLVPATSLSLLVVLPLPRYHGADR